MENILCSVCGLGFDSQIKLSQHFKTHDKRKFTCPTCGTSVTGNQALLNHKVSHERFTCNICKKEISKSSKSKLIKNLLMKCQS